MAGNNWINSYLEVILDVGPGLDDKKSSLLLRERGRFSPTRYFVDNVISDLMRPIFIALGFELKRRGVLGRGTPPPATGNPPPTTAKWYSPPTPAPTTPVVEVVGHILSSPPQTLPNHPPNTTGNLVAEHS